MIFCFPHNQDDENTDRAGNIKKEKNLEKYSNKA